MAAPFFWTISAIDDMDILFYIELLNYQEDKAYQEEVERAIRILG